MSDRRLDLITDFPSSHASELVISRDQELDRLAEGLVHGRGRMAVIQGSYGTGKTSLAYAFAHRYRDRFPAGVYVLDFLADPDRRLTEQVLDAVPDSRKQMLIVIDNAFAVGHESEPDFKAVLSARKSARLIVIAQEWLSSYSADVNITLSALSREDVARILQHGSVIPVTEAALANLCDQIGGNPAAVAAVARVLADPSNTPEQILASMEPWRQPGLFGPDGRPLQQGSPGSQRVIHEITAVSDELLASLASNPMLLYEISPRKFEEVVAELLHRDGYEVSVTQMTRDGGKDIYAAKKEHLGTFLFVVECKRYGPDKPVDVKLVRELFGVLRAENATAGVLVTTSYFTKDAIEFQDKVKYALTLQDYIGMQRWLQDTVVQRRRF